MVSYDGISPLVEKNYELACNVSANVIVTSYQWTKGGRILANETQVFLRFEPLSLNDSGCYSCQILVQSMTYLSKDIYLQGKF